MNKAKHLRRQQIKAMIKMTGSETFPIEWDSNMKEWVISEGWYTEEEAEGMEIHYSFSDDYVQTYGPDGRNPWDHSSWKSLDDAKVNDIFLNTIMAHDVLAREKCEMEIPSRYYAIMEEKEFQGPVILKVYGKMKSKNPSLIWDGEYFG